MASDVLFKVELGAVAVGWQLWVSLMVGVVLFELGLVVGAVGWLLLVLVVIGGVLFISVCIVGQGESSLRFQRMSDGNESQHGDTWVVGQGGVLCLDL